MSHRQGGMSSHDQAAVKGTGAVNSGALSSVRSVGQLLLLVEPTPKFCRVAHGAPVANPAEPGPSSTEDGAQATAASGRGRSRQRLRRRSRHGMSASRGATWGYPAQRGRTSACTRTAHAACSSNCWSAWDCAAVIGWECACTFSLHAGKCGGEARMSLFTALLWVSPH